MRGEPLQPSAPQLSKIRTFFICALALVWSTEMEFDLESIPPRIRESDLEAKQAV
jgi:hypothetical protein